MNEVTLAAGDGWLDQTYQSNTISDGNYTTTTGTWVNTPCCFCYRWPCQCHTVYINYPSYQPVVIERPERRPIKLSMRQMDVLRGAARRSKKLKEILELFTDHVEIVFELN